MDIFLDLDGTLTDNREGIVRSIRYALGEVGAERPEEAALLPWIGPPLQRSFLEHLGDPALAEQAVGHYRARYAETGLFENAVYPGVPEMMAALRREGHALWLATSKPRIYAERIVAHFGLRDALEGVFGAELDGTRAEKPELLAHAIATTATASAVMLGDRRYDMIGAAANSLPGIGALWGYGSVDELTSAGAARLAAHPDEVVLHVAHLSKMGG